MEMMVSTDEAGGVWVANAQGDLLAECFFKAADETPEELGHMGYRQLLQTYPAACLRVCQGVELADLEELFLEA